MNLVDALFQKFIFSQQLGTAKTAFCSLSIPLFPIILR